MRLDHLLSKEHCTPSGVAEARSDANVVRWCSWVEHLTFLVGLLLGREYAFGLESGLVVGLLGARCWVLRDRA